MDQPIRMIYVNLISLSILIFCLFIFRRKYPKKRISLLLLVILFSIPPIISVFRSGTYESGDLSLQSYASLSFYHSLLDGQIVPRWGGELINGFGSIYHMVMYLFPYYVISFFHFLGFSILNSIKAYLITTFISSGIAMYLFVKEEYGEKAGFASAILYLFAPYHLVDMHFRVDIGEMAAFVFVPLTFLFINRLISTKKPHFFFLSGISVALLVISHQGISLFFIPLLTVYSLVKSSIQKKGQKQLLFLSIGSIMFGAFLTSFYSFPLFFEAKKYTVAGLSMTKGGIELLGLSNYLFSPWRYGFLFQGPSGQLSFMIGYTQLFIVFFAIYLLFRHKIDKKHTAVMKFLLCSFVVILLILLPPSHTIWNTIPFLKYTLSTSRYVLILAFIASVVAGIVINSFKSQKFFIVLCAATIFYTILNWGNRGVIPAIKDDAYFENSISTFILGDNPKSPDLSSPIWAVFGKTRFTKKPTAHLEILSGDAATKEIYRNSITHEYLVDAKRDTSLLENTFYYPGWNLSVNNKPEKIDYQNPQNPGLITFPVKKGLNKVELNFGNTPLRRLGDGITLILLGVMGVFYLSIGIKKYNFFYRIRSVKRKP